MPADVTIQRGKRRRWPLAVDVPVRVSNRLRNMVALVAHGALLTATTPYRVVDAVVAATLLVAGMPDGVEGPVAKSLGATPLPVEDVSREKSAYGTRSDLGRIAQPQLVIVPPPPDELVSPRNAAWAALTVVVALAGGLVAVRLLWPDALGLALVAFAGGIAWDAFGTRLADVLVRRFVP